MADREEAPFQGRTDGDQRQIGGSVLAWAIALIVLGISFIACLVIATLLSDGGADLFSRRWPSVLFERDGAVLLRPIPTAVCVAFALNVAAWVPAAALRRETFFDLTGMLTFWALIIVCVVSTSWRHDRPATAWRYLPAALVFVWSARLGLFLFLRVLRSPSGDRRFDALKGSPARFLIPWTLQAVWAFLTTMAALVQITAPHADGTAFGGQGAALNVATGVGIVIWAVGFLVEVVADRQKGKFASLPQNRGRYIDTGLWSLSRHPNYVGEITIWVGMLVMGVRAYFETRWVCAASPIFVALLIRFVSGVPQLEQHADARWGHEVDYQDYKTRTPALIPPPFAPYKSHSTWDKRER